MDQYVSKNKVFFVGKIEEIQAALKQAAAKYKTIKEFIEKNLN